MSEMLIREYLAPKYSKARPCIKLNGFKGVTIHETGNTNKGAGAYNHALLLRGSGANAEKSWHYSVDDTIIYKSIPENEVAWHSGNRTGNYYTIAIEICVNSDSDFKKAVKNAAELTSDILKRHNKYDYEKYIYQHNDWSGKNCPMNLRKAGWADFLEMVGSYFTKKEVYKIGSSVTLNGYLYVDSYASKKGKYYTNKKCKITKIVDTKREAPYLLDNGLGWAKKENIKSY